MAHVIQTALLCFIICNEQTFWRFSSIKGQRAIKEVVQRFLGNVSALCRLTLHQKASEHVPTTFERSPDGHVDYSCGKICLMLLLVGRMYCWVTQT